MCSLLIGNLLPERAPRILFGPWQHLELVLAFRLTVTHAFGVAKEIYPPVLGARSEGMMIFLSLARLRGAEPHVWHRPGNVVLCTSCSLISDIIADVRYRV